MSLSLRPEERDSLIRILREAGVLYAILFGSAARGALTADSDLDIAVSAPQPLGSEARYKLVHRIAGLTGRPIDLVDLKTARGVVFARALEGEELFCDSVRAKGEALSRRAGLIEEDLAFARRSFAAARERLFR